MRRSVRKNLAPKFMPKTSDTLKKGIATLRRAFEGHSARSAQATRDFGAAIRDSKLGRKTFVVNFRVNIARLIAAIQSASKELQSSK